MALADFLNPDDYNPEQTEKEIAAGGLIPKDRYHCVLIAAEEKAAGDNVKTEMVFEIISGPYMGRKVRRDLFHAGKDHDKDRIAKNELLHFAIKLGVMVKATGADGKSCYQYAEGRTDFADAAQTECVVDVKHERWTRSDPNSDLVARVGMFGIYAMNDKEAIDCLKKLGLGAVDHNATAAPACGTNGHTNGHAKAGNTAPAAVASPAKRFAVDKL